jgi:hypothetical protein
MLYIRQIKKYILFKGWSTSSANTHYRLGIKPMASQSHYRDYLLTDE